MELLSSSDSEVFGEVTNAFIQLYKKKCINQTHRKLALGAVTKRSEDTTTSHKIKADILKFLSKMNYTSDEIISTILPLLIEEDVSQ